MPRLATSAAFCIFENGSAWNPEITFRPHFVLVRGEIDFYVVSYQPLKIWELSRMKRTFYAGVFALVLAGLLSNISASYASDGAAASIDVVRIKSALRLTPGQEPYWPPVENALRNLARQQATSEPEGLMRRISRRVISVVLNSAAVERLAVAARPLVGVLTQEQMRAASGLAQEMGLGPVVMAALK
jgi:hypothetical protein